MKYWMALNVFELGSIIFIVYKNFIKKVSKLVVDHIGVSWLAFNNFFVYTFGIISVEGCLS